MSNIIFIRRQAGYLPLTTAWIAATLETDTTILNALNTFEAGLIANSLTTKFNAIYPMVGGTSGKHAFNFMNTSLYSLTFNGGWTHSATGALPNGTNANADTGINANTILTVNNNHLSFYSRSNTAVGVAPNSKVSIVHPDSHTSVTISNAIGFIFLQSSYNIAPTTSTADVMDGFSFKILLV